MIKVGIVGASGYTGAELVRLLASHPQAKVVAATSETYAGKKFYELYPGLQSSNPGLVLTAFAKTDLSPQAVEVVFLALPHGESMVMAPSLLKTGIKVIDLSGDFRFSDTAIYQQWYHQEHTAPAWAAKAAYGLPELFREKIKRAALVSNPGCFATAAVLALYPLLQADWVENETLIVDAKTGMTGAGRKATLETQFSAISENIVPYKMGGQHQHTPEMEQALAQATGKKVKITFTPQMIPARRGILAIGYGKLKTKLTTVQLYELYQKNYQPEPFVRVRKPDEPWPDLASVVGSNNCVIGVAVDERTQWAVVAAAIDNLIKGASGQAIQSMNQMFGCEETLGLPKTGLVP